MEILKNHKHNIIIYILLIIIVILLFGKGKQGRYALSSANARMTFVLDTKTSQLWIRSGPRTVYLGTNKNPKFENVERRER